MNYNVNATESVVVAYLIDATGRPAAEITKAVAAHRDILSKGVRQRSYAYYVGDKIAEAAGLEYREDFDPDADAEDEDEDD